jgi:glycosyltransferase involved in cell wall biosynthesis
MKICINAINAKSRGITNYTAFLLRSLTETYELRIDLVIPQEMRDRYSILENSNVRFRTIPLEGKIAKTLYSNLVFPFFCLYKNYDLIHSVANTGVWISPIPQILTIHDTYEMVEKERFSLFKRIYMRLAVSFSGRFSRAILAVSNNTASDIRRFYPHLSSKTTVVYSGNNWDVLPTADVTYQKKKFFLFVGTLEPGKNIKTLLKAMEILIKRYPYCLTIVGAKGWKQDELPGLAEEMGIKEHVVFPGFVKNSELKELYMNTTALILPSVYEGFGFPIIEAMSHGAPVIAARNSAMPEAGGEAAIYFDTFDYEVLARQMIRIIEDKLLRKTSITKGLKQAAQFSWSRTASETYDLYCRFAKNER